MHRRITTEITLDEPDADEGLVSWLDIEVLDDRLDEEQAVVGRARVAIIHVEVAGGRLFFALDADSGELESLYEVYFEGDSFREEFFEGVGQDLLYVSEIELVPSSRGWNVELALVRRLCDTLGTGSALVVVRCADEPEAAAWRTMGFERTRGTSGLMHLRQSLVQPRVVRVEGEGQFRVVPVASTDARRRPK